jgi:hypothetical protein
MYGDRLVTEKEFRDEITNMLGSTPERLKKSSNPPWTIRYASQAPMTMKFGPDSVLIILRGVSFQSGDSPPRSSPMNIAASYQISKGETPKLLRQGGLQVLPPKLIAKRDKDGDGYLNRDEEGDVITSLTAQQSSLRSELMESYSTLLDKELEIEPPKLTGRWESLGQLKTDYLAAQPGWLTIGYQFDRAAAKPATKAKDKQ